MTGRKGTEHMRVMGSDFGSKTVGVSVSDPLGVTAQGVRDHPEAYENTASPDAGKDRGTGKRIRRGDLCFRLPQEYEQYHRRPGGEVPGA